MVRRAATALMLLAGTAWPALAQELPPEFDAGAPDGASATAFSDQTIDSYALPIAPFGTGEPATETVEGRTIRAAFRLVTEDNVASVIESYRQRLAELGFAPVFSCRSEDCGGFDFRFGAELLPSPQMLVDVENFEQLTLRRESDGTVASVLVSRVLDAIHIQTVVVTGSGSRETPSLTATAVQEDTLPVAPASGAREAALYDRLLAEGHVVVDGLDFDSGGARITDSSLPVLDTLADMIAQNELRLIIVGHSDSVGGLAANRQLSQERAEAVMRALIERGVAAERLSAEGIAFLAPLTANGTPEGRALNRRVELVLSGQ